MGLNTNARNTFCIFIYYIFFKSYIFLFSLRFSYGLLYVGLSHKIPRKGIEVCGCNVMKNEKPKDCEGFVNHSPNM